MCGESCFGDFEKTKQQIKEKFNEDMQHIIKLDKVESAAISDAVKNNHEIKSYNSTETAEASLSSANIDYSEEVEDDTNDDEEGIKEDEIPEVQELK